MLLAAAESSECALSAMHGSSASSSSVLVTAPPQAAPRKLRFLPSHPSAGAPGACQPGQVVWVGVRAGRQAGRKLLSWPALDQSCWPCLPPVGS